MLGGNRKRNIRSLDEDLQMMLFWCFFNVLDDCLIFVVQAYQDTVGE